MKMLITAILLTGISFNGSLAATDYNSSRSNTESEGIMVDQLVVDEREMTSGCDWDYRIFSPGDAHYGSVTVRARMVDAKPGLKARLKALSQGQSSQKSISLVLQYSLKESPVYISLPLTCTGVQERSKRDDDRTFILLDCFPTKSGTGNLYEEVNIKPIRIELA